MRALVRNLKLRNCFAQTVRVHTKHLRRGAVRGVGGRGHQLLRPLHPLHPGPAARTVEPGGGRRARIFRGHKALLQPRARKPAAAGPRRTARRALAQYEEAETNARLDSYMQDIGESKYRFVTASVVANTVNRAQNLITLNRGRQDGVVEEMAVLSPTARWPATSSTARNATPWRCRC